MTEYQKGQRVRVEVEGTISAVMADGSFAIANVPGTRFKDDGLLNPKVTVTPLDPPDWPPQVGDIWEADGEEWFAAWSMGNLVMVPAGEGCSFILDEFKALQPVLVRRRGQLWAWAIQNHPRRS